MSDAAPGTHLRRQPTPRPALDVPATPPPALGALSPSPRGSDSKPSAPTHHKRVLSTLGFALVAFFLVGGGPYGLELSAGYAGPGPVFASFVVLPLVWSLPQALMTAELATLLPENGGFVRWLTAAFGDAGGWIIGVNGAAGSVLDLALYPALLVSYGEAAVGSSGSGDAPPLLSPAARYAARLAVVALGVGVNMRGIGDVSAFSGAIVAVVMAPFVIACALRGPAMWAGGWAWTRVHPRPRWSLFLASVLWAHSGWDSCGSFAGEVQRPGETYVAGSAVTAALVFVTYALPLLLAVQTRAPGGAWGAGALQRACRDAAAPLGAAAAAGAMLSQLAMFTSGLSASARAVWALSGGGGGGGVAHLPRALAREVGATGAPAASRLAHAAAVAALSALPFDALITVNSALGTVRILLEAAAFVQLRVAAPGAPRPFRVPGGACGAAAVVAPVVVVAAATAALADRSVWVTVLGLNAVAAAVFAARAAADARRARVWWPRGRWNLATDATWRFADGGAKSSSLSAADDAAFASGDAEGGAISGGSGGSGDRDAPTAAAAGAAALSWGGSVVRRRPGPTLGTASDSSGADDGGGGGGAAIGGI